MGLRIVVVVTVLALILLAQVQAAQVSPPREGGSVTAAHLLDGHFNSVAVADNDDGDNDDADNDDGDNDDADNDDGDNDDADNSSSVTSDPNEDVVIENVSPDAAPTPAAAAAPSPGPAASPAASAPAPAPAGPTVTEATGTSTGGDVTIALPNNHVAVQIFPWMPAGITLTVRLIDPVTAPAAPGTRVGDLVFVLEARDSAGAPLTMLPAEVNLDVSYTDEDAAGLDDQTVTLSWLDPADSQWKTAPKLLTNPVANTVAASVTQLGTYVVSIP